MGRSYGRLIIQFLGVKINLDIPETRITRWLVGRGDEYVRCHHDDSYCSMCDEELDEDAVEIPISPDVREELGLGEWEDDDTEYTDWICGRCRNLMQQLSDDPDS